MIITTRKDREAQAAALIAAIAGQPTTYQLAGIDRIGLTWSTSIFGTEAEALAALQERAGRPEDGWYRRLVFATLSDGERILHRLTELEIEAIAATRRAEAIEAAKAKGIDCDHCGAKAQTGGTCPACGAILPASAD